MFKNRKEAGERLADALTAYKIGDPLILAIPRGGVEIGYHVAKKLSCEFSIVVVRKLGYPYHPEAAFGAMAEDNSLYLNSLHQAMEARIVKQVKKKEAAEIQRRVQLYRKGEPLPDIKGRTVILVDDGIATGATLLAAIELCKRQQAGKIVVGAPVSGAYMKRSLRNLVDEVVILNTPPNYYAVSQAYEDFRAVTDEKVISFMEQAKRMKLKDETPERPESAAP